MNGADEHEIATACANFGKEESKMICLACRIVKYCDKDCQIEHRRRHKQACKKRAAELHEEALFRVPPKAEDCPICFITLPESMICAKRYRPCCGKTFCSGCLFADMKQNNGRRVCLSCRAPSPENIVDAIDLLYKRAEINDPNGLAVLGVSLEDKSKGLEYLVRGAELGSPDASNAVANAYFIGDGVAKDEKKATHYYKLAAMQGHRYARHNLGANEYNAGKFDIALKHWLIACRRGNAKSLGAVKHLLIGGYATKKDYEKALRSYQEYLDVSKAIIEMRLQRFMDTIDTWMWYRGSLS